MSAPPAWIAKRGPMSDLARIEDCPRCRRHVLRALVEALDCRVDPTPIGPLAELQALTENRMTYDAHLPMPGHLRLYWRDPWRIAARRGLPVLAEHRCGRELPSTPILAPRTTRTEITADGEFPF